MICRRCNEDKPLTEFYENYRINGGYNKTCKVCLKEIRKLKYIPASPRVPIEDRFWSNESLMCYKRLCMCTGCYYETFFSSVNQRCQMKHAVRKLINKYGKPTLEEINNVKPIEEDKSEE